ncbi:MAG: hypothetical protein OXF89_03000, partial [Rhodospirillaceae bacterium]|nr:hypothetical protein [Rhodospirillaceae bacterium]
MQDLGEGAAAPLEESELVRAVRVPGAQLFRQALRIAEACVRQRVPGPDGDGQPAIRFALQYPCLGQNSEQPAEQPPVLLHDTQRIAKCLRLDGRTRAAPPAQPVERREHIGDAKPVQVSEQGGPLFWPDILGREIVGERSRPGADRFRAFDKLCRLKPSGQGLFPPDDFVQEILERVRRGEHGGARRPLHREPVHAADRRAGRVEEAQIGLDDFRRVVRVLVRIAASGGLAHADMAEDPFGRRPRQPQPVPAEGHVGGFPR